jgi:hypothetical protein
MGVGAPAVSCARAAGAAAEARRSASRTSGTTARIDEGAIARLKERMLGLGCPHALLFDSIECLILRDTYTSLDVDSLQEDGRLPTSRVLARVQAPGNALDQRVLRWLQSMAANWNTALPVDRDVAAPFITDIVPAVSGSSIREVA